MHFFSIARKAIHPRTQHTRYDEGMRNEQYLMAATNRSLDSLQVRKNNTYKSGSDPVKWKAKRRHQSAKPRQSTSTAGGRYLVRVWREAGEGGREAEGSGGAGCYMREGGGGGRENPSRLQPSDADEGGAVVWAASG